MKRARRFIAAFAALTMLCSCATILYPERKGNTGGRVDVGPLILDILWFIPGIIPGVIALVVDFVTGAIYVGGKRGDVEVGREGAIAIRKPAVTTETHAELRLVDDAGRVLDRDFKVWRPDGRRGKAQALEVDLAKAAAEHPEADPVALRLELQLGEQAPVVYAMTMRGQGSDAAVPTPTAP